MLIPLLEDTPPEQILTDKLRDIIMAFPSHMLVSLLGGSQLKRVLVDGLDSYRLNALKCQNDSQRTCFLLYTRAWIMQELVKGEMNNDNGHREINYERLINALGPLLRYYERLKTLCAPLISAIQEYRQRNRGENILPNELLTRLLHFKGSSDGGVGVQIPGIVGMRIAPNAFLPDVLDQMKAMEIAWQQEQIAKNQGGAEAGFATLFDVPKKYIRYNEADRENIIAEYSNGYAWYDLEGNSNEKEAAAMGHCASNSQADTLYSLRKVTQIYIVDQNTTLPFYIPMLTAAVDDNTLLELRGPYNTKPKSEFHPYIIDFIEQANIDSIRPSNYNPRDQFLIDDLSKEQQEQLYRHKPKLRGETWMFFHPEQVDPVAWNSIAYDFHEQIERNLSATIIQTEDNGRVLTLRSNLIARDIASNALKTAMEDHQKQIKALLNWLDDKDYTFQSNRYDGIITKTMPKIFDALANTKLATGVIPRLAGILRGKPNRIPKSNSKLYKHTFSAIQKFYGDSFGTAPEKIMDLIATAINDYDISSSRETCYYPESGSTLSDKLLIHSNLYEEYRQYYDGRDEEGDTREWLPKDDPHTDFYNLHYEWKDNAQQFLRLMNEIDKGDYLNNGSPEIEFDDLFDTRQLSLPGMERDPVQLFYPYIEEAFTGHWPYVDLDKYQKTLNRLTKRPMSEAVKMVFETRLLEAAQQLPSSRR